MTTLNYTRYYLSNNSWYDEGVLPTEIDGDFNRLWDAHPKEYGLVKIYGKVIHTPRWQQTYGRAYEFSGINHTPLETPPLFQPFWDWATTTEYGPFNQMLVNWYQNGHHYIGAHSDDETFMKPDTPIVSISLGASRKFRIREKKTNMIVKDIMMSHGMILVMGGNFQKEFKHEVPKIGGKKGEVTGRRINITFRCFLDE